MAYRLPDLCLDLLLQQRLIAFNSYLSCWRTCLQLLLLLLLLLPVALPLSLLVLYKWW